MPRPPRVHVPGGIFHVTIRGNNRQTLFQSDADYQQYLIELRGCLPDHACHALAYALMPNHVHLVLQDQQASLSRLMHVLNARYTRYVNQRYGRVGQLYQGRFYSKLVDRDDYLLEVTRYVHLNPVKAHLVARPEDYTWSSYRSYIGMEQPPLQLAKPQAILSLLSKDAARQPGLYRDFVKAMTPEQFPRWESRLRQLKLIGSPRLARQVPGTSPEKCLALLEGGSPRPHV